MWEYRFILPRNISCTKIRDHLRETLTPLCTLPRMGSLRSLHLHVRARIDRPLRDLSHHFSADNSAVPTITKPDTVEIILFCGSPGSGKSSYYWKKLQPLGYGRVNQDILKTVSAGNTCFGKAAHAVPLLRSLSNMLKQRDKCVKAATALVEDGTSVVVGTYFRNLPMLYLVTRAPSNDIVGFWTSRSFPFVCANLQ